MKKNLITLLSVGILSIAATFPSMAGVPALAEKMDGWLVPRDPVTKDYVKGEFKHWHPAEINAETDAWANERKDKILASSSSEKDRYVMCCQEVMDFLTPYAGTESPSTTNASILYTLRDGLSRSSAYEILLSRLLKACGINYDAYKINDGECIGGEQGYIVGAYVEGVCYYPDLQKDDLGVASTIFNTVRKDGDDYHSIQYVGSNVNLVGNCVPLTRASEIYTNSLDNIPEGYVHCYGNFLNKTLPKDAIVELRLGYDDFKLPVTAEEHRKYFDLKPLSPECEAFCATLRAKYAGQEIPLEWANLPPRSITKEESMAMVQKEIERMRNK